MEICRHVPWCRSRALLGGKKMYNLPQWLLVHWSKKSEIFEIQFVMKRSYDAFASDSSRSKARITGKQMHNRRQWSDPKMYDSSRGWFWGAWDLKILESFEIDHLLAVKRFYFSASLPIVAIEKHNRLWWIACSSVMVVFWELDPRNRNLAICIAQISIFIQIAADRVCFDNTRLWGIALLYLLHSSVECSFRSDRKNDCGNPKTLDLLSIDGSLCTTTAKP